MHDTNYKPVVPGWVATILQDKKAGKMHYKAGKSKQWDAWKESYSRKYKYAMLNGWISEDDLPPSDSDGWVEEGKVKGKIRF